MSQNPPVLLNPEHAVPASAHAEATAGAQIFAPGPNDGVPFAGSSQSIHGHLSQQPLSQQILMQHPEYVMASSAPVAATPGLQLLTHDPHSGAGTQTAADNSTMSVPVDPQYPVESSGDNAAAHSDVNNLMSFVRHLEQKENRLKCSPKKRASLLEIFRSMDQDNDGKLSREELHVEVHSPSSKSISKDVVQSLVNKMADGDFDENGCIDIEDALDHCLQTEPYKKKNKAFMVRLVLVTCWFTIGPAVFCNVENWPLLDAIYFSIVTLSTVGYGDLSPNTDSLKVFTMFYILTGIGIVGEWVTSGIAGILGDYEDKLRGYLQQGGHPRKSLNVLRSLGEGCTRLTAKLMGSTSYGVDITDQAMGKKLRHVQVLAGAKMLIAALLLLAPIIIGACWMHFYEKFTVVDSFYWAVVTSSTVGYGDLSMESKSSKVFTSCYILCAIVFLSTAFAKFGEAQLDLRNAKHEIEVHSRCLSMDMLSDMDHDGNGIDKTEFLCAMLIALKKVEVEDICDILKRFAELDDDSSGRLDAADLRRASADLGKVADQALPPPASLQEQFVKRGSKLGQNTGIEGSLQSGGSGTSSVRHASLLSGSGLLQSSPLRRGSTRLDDSLRRSPQARQNLKGSPEMSSIRNASEDQAAVIQQLLQENIGLQQLVNARATEIMQLVQDQRKIEQDMQKLYVERQAYYSEVQRLTQECQNNRAWQQNEQEQRRQSDDRCQEAERRCADAEQRLQQAQAECLQQQREKEEMEVEKEKSAARAEAVFTAARSEISILRRDQHEIRTELQRTRPPPAYKHGTGIQPRQDSPNRSRPGMLPTGNEHWNVWGGASTTLRSVADTPSPRRQVQSGPSLLSARMQKKVEFCQEVMNQSKLRNVADVPSPRRKIQSGPSLLSARMQKKVEFFHDVMNQLEARGRYRGEADNSV